VININFGDVFKYLGAFISKNWQGIGLVVMLVLFFVTKNDYASLKKSLDVMNTSYEEQIAALEALHLKELAAREEAINEFERELSDLTKKYDDAVDNLKKSKEEDIKEFVRDFTEQPEELAREIEEAFGFEYVE
jgi:predicted nuclease with TOPRIM domain